MTWRLEFKRSAEREFDRLPRVVRERLRSRIDRLVENPKPPGSRKLTGSSLYRIRVGDYRVIYSVDEDEQVVVVTRVRHRSRAYRGPLHSSSGEVT